MPETADLVEVAGNGTPRADGTDGSVAGAVAGARAAFVAGATKPLAWRTAQLEALRRMLNAEEGVLAEALAADLGKAATESWLTEIGITANEVTHTLRHLRSWLRPRRVGVPAWLLPSTASVVREPLGTVLVISAWNYPVYLSLVPLIGAIAGGNAVVLKPSEVAPATSRALAELLPKYLDPAAVRVVEGGVPETTALLAERFDHIFYTGNGHVGRIVMEAAAKHLTPVTLELGGKSPTFVDADADLEVAARRIVWGRFTNAGQTCVAPDYVIATRPVLDSLKPLLAKAIEEFYGSDPATSGAYGRIVNERHYDRVEALLESGTVASGGRRDRESRYIEPTVLDGVTGEDPVMQDEIFGPVLPLVEVAGIDEAISFINDRDRPLALYVFTRSAETRRRFTRDTSSGALNFNLPMAHLGAPDLPFGGVGPSGMGSYHGEQSVITFTHSKPVLRVPTRPDLISFIYPPFTGVKETVIRRFIAPTRKS